VIGFPPGHILVSDRRDLAVGIDLDEFRLVLFAIVNVDHMQTVGRTGFLQEDRNFAAVAGGPGVNVDHGALSLLQ
jgi:hypothetical protein